MPHLARVGVRHSYELPCHASVGENAIDFWCDDDSCELDVQYPSKFDKLSWEICVVGGWCGGLIDGQPTTVDDLLPTVGQITAERFAELAIRADGWPEGEPFDEKHVTWLNSKFVEHFGAETVDVSDLRRNLTNPFE